MYYSIGEFSKLVDVSIYTLRYYEEQGLILPQRKENGRRFYSEKDIAWIVFIKKLKNTKMPIKEIKEYSNLRSLGNKTLNERMLLLQVHRNNLMRDIDELTKDLKNLDDKINYYKEEIFNLDK